MADVAVESLFWFDTGGLTIPEYSGSIYRVTTAVDTGAGWEAGRSFSGYPMANMFYPKGAQKMLGGTMRSFQPTEVLRPCAAGRAAPQESAASRLRARQDQS